MSNFCLEIDFFKIAFKNRNFPEICLEKSKFLTQIHDPHISNQIDAIDLG